MVKVKALGEIAENVPFFKKFEIDKVFQFIRLLIVAPTVAITLGVIIGLGFEYYQNKDDSMLLLMIYFLITFFISIVTNALLIYKIEDIKIKRDDREQRLNILEISMTSEEILRHEWHDGYRKIILADHARLNDLFIRVLKTPFVSETDRSTVLTMINGGFAKVYEEYEHLFGHISSPLNEFSIGMKAPPQTPDTSHIDRIEEIYKKLSNIN